MSGARFFADRAGPARVALRAAVGAILAGLAGRARLVPASAGTALILDFRRSVGESGERAREQNGQDAAENRLRPGQAKMPRQKLPNEQPIQRRADATQDAETFRPSILGKSSPHHG